MAKVMKKRWRPSLGMVRGLQIEIDSLQMVIAKAATEYRNKIDEMSSRLDRIGRRLQSECALHDDTRVALRIAMQTKGWWDRFWSLFGL